MDIILKTLPYAVPATLAEMSKVQKWLKERDLWPATCEQQQRFLRASVAALVGVQELDRKTTYDEMLFIVATFRKTPPSSGKPREDPSSPGDEDVKSKLEIARQNLEQDSSYGQGPSVLQTIAECVVLIVTTLVGISGRSLLNISNASTGYKLATVSGSSLSCLHSTTPLTGSTRTPQKLPDSASLLSLCMWRWCCSTFLTFFRLGRLRSCPSLGPSSGVPSLGWWLYQTW